MARTRAGDAHLSIGDLAAATGLSPDTIRVWERRYGRPQPVRLPSGHRRYTEEHVRWLRRVAAALSCGYRAGTVVRTSDEDLDRLLDEAEAAGADDEGVRALLARVRAFDPAGLADLLADQHRQLGTERFLEERLAPLLVSAGRMWADGTLDVRHEHFLSEVVEDVLRSIRLRLPAAGGKGPVLLATLPGEVHGLGLQMAALVCAELGLPARVLGTETPIEEIVAAVGETGARAVALSISLSSGGVETDRKLNELRRRLPRGVRLVIGGRGARGVRRGVRGADYVESLRAFATWLGGLAA